ncbi:MAG: CotH kinase family protein, partial [Erysipelotrichaceae bacterium]|nr:CotH kinase family protein [Erysipelotrichaceae bacterium]
PEGMQRPEMPEGAGPGGNMEFGSDAKGSDLKYTDDEISSYSDIFDNNETDASEEDQQKVIAALKALSENDSLETYLDTDEVIRYFAAHNFVLNYDSYTGNMLHNYYLYENEGKLSMLPWDYNLAFGAFGGAGGQKNAGSDQATSLINTGIDTPLSGVSEGQRPMWSWIASDEAYLNQYHDVYDELLSSYFESGDFEKEIDQLYELILPYVEKDPSAFYTAEEFTSAVRTLKQVCMLRAESIRAQLNGELSCRTDEQDPEKQIDASDISIQSMGSHGGPDQGQPQSFNPSKQP